METQVVFLGSLQFTLDGATEAQVTTAVELTLAARWSVKDNEYSGTCQAMLVPAIRHSYTCT